jgi:hypothetical protein
VKPKQRLRASFFFALPCSRPVCLSLSSSRLALIMALMTAGLPLLTNDAESPPGNLAFVRSIRSCATLQVQPLACIRFVQQMFTCAAAVRRYAVALFYATVVPSLAEQIKSTYTTRTLAPQLGLINCTCSHSARKVSVCFYLLMKTTPWPVSPLISSGGRPFSLFYTLSSSHNYSIWQGSK